MLKRLVVLAALAFPWVANAAYTFDVTLRGSKTVFAGDPHLAPHTVKGLELSYQLAASYDPVTGLPTGRRQHAPVTIIKEWDAATPQLLGAMATNETLPTVTINFHTVDNQGRAYTFMRIMLSNARVVSDKLHAREVDPSTWQGNAPNDTIYSKHELEEVTFVFQKIVIENFDGKTSFVDDWSSALAMLPKAQADAAAKVAARETSAATPAAAATGAAGVASTKASIPTKQPAK